MTSIITGLSLNSLSILGSPIDVPENLIAASNDFTQWTNTRSSDAISGDATKLTLDGTANSSHIIKSPSLGFLAIGTPYTYSMEVRAVEINWVRLMLTDASVANQFSAYFNISAGTTGGSAESGDGSFDTSNIQSLGGGWFSCSITGVFSSTIDGFARTYLAEGDGDTSINGDGVSGVLIRNAALTT